MNVIFGVFDNKSSSKFLKKAKQYNIKIKLVTQARYGGGGSPEFQFTGSRADLVKYFVKTKFLNSIQINKLLDKYGK